MARTSRPRPDELWVTDVTEFRIPAGHLSAVVDCTTKPGRRRIAQPTASLANGSLLDALAARREGAHRGAQRPRGRYRWPGWIAIWERLARSMSASSPDNAARGFFGRLRTQFFGLEGVSLAEFSERLDA